MFQGKTTNWLVKRRTDEWLIYSGMWKPTGGPARAEEWREGKESLFGDGLKEKGRQGTGDLWDYIVVSIYWSSCFVHEAKMETGWMIQPLFYKIQLQCNTKNIQFGTENLGSCPYSCRLSKSFSLARLPFLYLKVSVLVGDDQSPRFQWS